MSSFSASAVSARRLAKFWPAVLATSLGLTGCGLLVTPSQNAVPYRGPAPYQSVTPSDAALRCLRQYVAKADNLRIGVADFVDGTGAGAGENDVATRMMTQRPDLMLMVALRKAGVRLVNRTSIGVVEWELKEAMAKRLGEGRPVKVDNQQFAYRPVQAGSLVGSTYYLNGAITEYNYNISSNTMELGGLGIMAGRRTYRTSVAVDLAVTKSTSTEVVMARSYAKQLEGQEMGGGVFRFFDVAMGLTRIELFEANVGEKRNEPVQTALRWVIETAAYDLVSELVGRQPECERLLPGFRDDTNLPYGGSWNQRDSDEPQPLAPIAPALPAKPANETRRAINPPVNETRNTEPSPNEPAAPQMPAPEILPPETPGASVAPAVTPPQPRTVAAPSVPVKEVRAEMPVVAPPPPAMTTAEQRPVHLTVPVQGRQEQMSPSQPPAMPVVTSARTEIAPAPRSVSAEMQNDSGCSRLAINLPPGISLSFAKSSNAAQLRFNPAMPVDLKGAIPPHFVTVATAPGTLTMRLKENVQITSSAQASQLTINFSAASAPARCHDTAPMRMAQANRPV